jgi:hypothetical protein
MKYTSMNISQLDQEIEEMYDLSMPNSAFKKVIPADVKLEMRNKYIEHLNANEEHQRELKSQLTTSQPISQQVIKVNISSLREAGYCICPEELAAACEILLRNHASDICSKNTSDMNVPTKELRSVRINPVTGQEEIESDFETTDLNSDIDFKIFNKGTKQIPRKQYPKKIVSEEFGKSKISSVCRQKRSLKIKYFTRYMSDEFSKDTEPVNMSMMDSKTKQLFMEQDFNNLVSEITGIN